MAFTSRLQYYQRIFRAYLTPGKSQLSFWHDVPQQNPRASLGELGEYYMDFPQKADYVAHCDASGVPMLDYHGQIGLQYNPIAIAQWGLGNYNLLCRSGGAERKAKVLAASDWLCARLEQNATGTWVWNHHFDWEYRDRLRAPWHSGLAQGQGISLLLRAHKLTGDASLLEAAGRAFDSFTKPMLKGGVAFTDDRENLWFEEYIVSPPTHILNGFIWAMWGVLDYFLVTKSPTAEELFRSAVQTLRENLDRYDLGFWSLYEQSGTRLKMVASRFYHQLHIVQLEVMQRLTGEKIFADYAERWRNYARSPFNRTRALCYKTLFKLCYY